QPISVRRFALARGRRTRQGKRHKGQGKATASDQADQPQRGDERECEQEPIEQALMDMDSQPSAEKDAGENRRTERSIQRQGLSMNQSERNAEGDLECIDDKEKPSAGADQVKLWQRDRQTVDGEDGSGGARQ